MRTETSRNPPNGWAQGRGRAAVPPVASRGRTGGRPYLERTVLRWPRGPGRPLLGVCPGGPDSRLPQWGLPSLVSGAAPAGLHPESLRELGSCPRILDPRSETASSGLNSHIYVK